MAANTKMSGFETWFLKIQFSGNDRLRIYRKLSRYLSNGQPLTVALETMWAHASRDGKKPKAVQAVVIDNWLRSVENGKSFGVAIDGWVPHGDAVVIRSGEDAGKLSEALDNATLLFEGQRAIKGAVIAGVAYPILLIALAIGFMVMFGTNVIPAFEEIVPRDQWMGVGAQMAVMSDFVRFGLIPTLCSVLAVIAVVVWSMPRWTGMLRAKVDRVPPYSIYRLVAGSGFMLSVAALVKAGVKITSVLEILGHKATPWYRERINKTLVLVNNGNDIGDALYKTGLNFPDYETVNDLRAYAKLDKFDESLMVLGKQNLEEAIGKIKVQAAVLRNVGIVCLGGIFAWIAVGIFDLQSQIQSGL